LAGNVMSRRWFTRSGNKSPRERVAPPTVDISDRPHVFTLVRHSDPSGVSGIGIIAWGVMFNDNKAIVRWRGETTGVQQICVFDSIYDIETVHGHGGETQVVFFPGPYTDAVRFAQNPMSS
jgi:hypothetical protein